MRQIWEKETKLTKEEVHERLEKYFTDNKYINATDEMGVLYEKQIFSDIL